MLIDGELDGCLLTERGSREQQAADSRKVLIHGLR
jgi:hypothetical protein